jgi:hypothetical protein
LRPSGISPAVRCQMADTDAVRRVARPP